ncbi:MAG: cation diffusion facilitator family transporter [Candidatus Gastranaerophilales bacterium]|nr:cation diffusion facilitator family transporter [Candidatus Gastranaerophilales bacterium]
MLKPDKNKQTEAKIFLLTAIRSSYYNYIVNGRRTMQANTKKKAVAGLSIVSNVVLSALKIAVGIFSGSLCIISEAIHSMMDLMASMLAFFSVVKSSQPADSDHPYGHGKYEDLSGFIEGLLIIFASIFIIYEAYKRILSGEFAETENIYGIIVMFIAVVANIIVSSLLFKVAKQTNSISLYADGEHLKTDIYSSLGVLVGLVLIKITGDAIIDPIIALLIAVLIFKTGEKITKKAIKNLLDYSIPKEEIEKIKEIVKSHNFELKENTLKARQVGPSIDIDMTLLFSEEKTICECHKLCENIEKQICETFPNCSISIHAEPECYSKNCQINCKKN